MLAIPDFHQPRARQEEGYKRHTTSGSCPHRAYNLIAGPSILPGVAKVIALLHTQQQLFSKNKMPPSTCFLSTSTAPASPQK